MHHYKKLLKKIYQEATMNRKQAFGIMWVIALVSCIGLLFSSCKTPLSESDVPEEEWTVTYAGYYQPTGEIEIEFGELGNVFTKYSYSNSFDNTASVDWSTIIHYPDIVLISNIDPMGNSIYAFDPSKPTIPSRTLISFSDTWFYQIDNESILNPTVRAKVRIATRSIPITTVEY